MHRYFLAIDLFSTEPLDGSEPGQVAQNLSEALTVIFSEGAQVQVNQMNVDEIEIPDAPPDLKAVPDGTGE